MREDLDHCMHSLTEVTDIRVHSTRLLRILGAAVGSQAFLPNCLMAFLGDLRVWA